MLEIIKWRENLVFFSLSISGALFSSAFSSQSSNNPASPSPRLALPGDQADEMLCYDALLGDLFLVIGLSALFSQSLGEILLRKGLPGHGRGR